MSTKAYLSDKSDKSIIESLMSLGFNTVLLPPFSSLSAPVDSHADMLLFESDGVLFAHENYKAMLDARDFEGFERFLTVSEPIAEKYPQDILLNILLVGDTVFANTKYASRTVLEYLKMSGKKIFHVSQGYAHCSVCKVAEDAIITADRGIFTVAEGAGIDALLIEKGNIALPPYEYGFIGGASGVFGDSVYFTGSLSYHPDGERIRAFCQKHGKNTTELTDAPLSDIGGILFK
ncbi:MAG: DUF6873 family GME fold protein [Eubacteriales bacterium]